MKVESFPIGIESAYVVGFGDAVRSAVENDEPDYERAEAEARNWTRSDAYINGFRAGALWYALSR